MVAPTVGFDSVDFRFLHYDVTMFVLSLSAPRHGRSDGRLRQCRLQVSPLWRHHVWPRRRREDPRHLEELPRWDLRRRVRRRLEWAGENGGVQTDTDGPVTTAEGGGETYPTVSSIDQRKRLLQLLCFFLVILKSSCQIYSPLWRELYFVCANALFCFAKSLAIVYRLFMTEFTQSSHVGSPVWLINLLHITLSISLSCTFLVLLASFHPLSLFQVYPSIALCFTIYVFGFSSHSRNISVVSHAETTELDELLET